jgi:hypothetical protein
VVAFHLEGWSGSLKAVTRELAKYRLNFVKDTAEGQMEQRKH